jgi:hypothetical protein
MLEFPDSLRSDVDVPVVFEGSAMRILDPKCKQKRADKGARSNWHVIYQNLDPDSPRCGQAVVIPMLGGLI